MASSKKECVIEMDSLSSTVAHAKTTTSRKSGNKSCHCFHIQNLGFHLIESDFPSFHICFTGCEWLPVWITAYLVVKIKVFRIPSPFLSIPAFLLSIHLDAHQPVINVPGQAWKFSLHAKEEFLFIYFYCGIFFKKQILTFHLSIFFHRSDSYFSNPTT